MFIDLCRGLKAQGHLIGAVVRRGSSLQSALRNANIEIAMSRKRGGAGLFSARRLANIIDADGWQLVNAHTPPDYIFAALARRLSSSKPKLVLTRHILLPLGNSLFHKWTLGSADAFIAVSDAVKETLTKHPSIDASKVKTIWNGIDTERFVPQGTRSLREQLAVGGNERLVGILGDVSPHKGQEVFVKAALLLLQGGHAAKFVVAGPTRPKNRPYLRRLRSMVRDSGRSSEILFVGRISDMPDAMRSLDVMALASEAEPFGLVTVEAMACGCAVVATRSGASSEIITNGRDGMLFEPGSHEALANALRDVLDDEVARTRLCEHARETALQNFTLKRNIDEIERLFRELCDQG